MSVTDCPAGSKLNPLSEEIHQRDVAHHNWLGGWVGTSDNPTYHDLQNVERTCNGSLSSPYDADVYDELTENGMWIGGWVLEEGESLAFLYLLLSYLHFFRISGFALDTSARQSNEKFFTLFLAFALA